MDTYTHGCLSCGTILTDGELQIEYSVLCGAKVQEFVCPYCGGSIYRMDNVKIHKRRKSLNDKLK